MSPNWSTKVPGQEASQFLSQCLFVLCQAETKREHAGDRQEEADKRQEQRLSKRGVVEIQQERSVGRILFSNSCLQRNLHNKRSAEASHLGFPASVCIVSLF